MASKQVIKKIMADATRAVRLSRDRLAELGGVHPTTLAKYPSRKAALTPKPIWLVQYIQALINQLEANIESLNELQVETMQLLEGTPEFEVVQTLAEAYATMLTRAEAGREE